MIRFVSSNASGPVISTQRSTLTSHIVTSFSSAWYSVIGIVVQGRQEHVVVQAPALAARSLGRLEVRRLPVPRLDVERERLGRQVSLPVVWTRGSLPAADPRSLARMAWPEGTMRSGPRRADVDPEGTTRMEMERPTVRDEEHPATSGRFGLEELGAADLRFRRMVERLPAIVYVETGGHPGPTVYLSPRIEDVLGYAAEEFLQSGNALWSEIIHPDDGGFALELDGRSEVTKEPYAAEYRLQGARRPVGVVPRRGGVRPRRRRDARALAGRDDRHHRAEAAGAGAIRLGGDLQGPRRPAPRGRVHRERRTTTRACST